SHEERLANQMIVFSVKWARNSGTSLFEIITYKGSCVRTKPRKEVSRFNTEKAEVVQKKKKTFWLASKDRFTGSPLSIHFLPERRRLDQARTVRVQNICHEIGKCSHESCPINKERGGEFVMVNM
ncbi:hypothetical protein BaRGS_00010440, partial [Batillaria attramentaria]